MRGGAAISAGLAGLKEQVYADPRPKEYFDRFHERARTHEPSFAYEVVRLLTSLYAFVLLRARSRGAENVPECGAAIVAPNHFSFMDHFLLGSPLRRKVRFMGKSQLFTGAAGWVYAQGGVFPVRRGARDEETFITAEAILGRGGVVVMYPEGGRSRTGELAPRAKPGIGRLALESGAPVVPVAILGSYQVRNWRKLRFTKVIVQYGEPFRFERVPHSARDQQQAAAEVILERIRGMHDELAALGARRAARTLRAARAGAGGSVRRSVAGS